MITSSDSTIALINGAQECNVFWQVGSSATLGTNSVFVGTIMAMASITATTGTIVHGRLLARNGAVTLDSNTVESPTCDLGPTATTTSSSSSTSSTPSTTSTTSVLETTTTSAGPSTTSSSGVTTTALPSATTTPSATASTSAPTTASVATTAPPEITTAPTFSPPTDSVLLVASATTSIAPEPPPVTTTKPAASATVTASKASTTTTKPTTTLNVGVQIQSSATPGQLAPGNSTTPGRPTVKVLGETIIPAGEAPTAIAIVSQPKFTG